MNIPAIPENRICPAKEDTLRIKKLQKKANGAYKYLFFRKRAFKKR